MDRDEVEAIQAGGVSRKGWRNGMFVVGLLCLAGAMMGLANGEDVPAAVAALIALVWFVAARLIFPTDR